MCFGKPTSISVQTAVYLPNYRYRVFFATRKRKSQCPLTGVNERPSLLPGIESSSRYRYFNSSHSDYYCFANDDEGTVIVMCPRKSLRRRFVMAFVVYVGRKCCHSSARWELVVVCSNGARTLSYPGSDFSFEPSLQEGKVSVTAPPLLSEKLAHCVCSWPDLLPSSLVFLASSWWEKTPEARKAERGSSTHLLAGLDSICPSKS